MTAAPAMKATLLDNYRAIGPAAIVAALHATQRRTGQSIPK